MKGATKVANKEIDVIEWSEPPEVKRKPRTSKYAPIIESLKANPGKWAHVMSDVNTASARVFINNGCKITTRSNGNESRVDVWAMFPGEDGEHDNESMPDMTEAIRRSPAPKKAAAKKTAAKKSARPRAKSAK